MKKEHVLLSLLLSFLSSVYAVNASAQQEADSLPVKSGNEWKMPGQALRQSQRFADSVKRMCSLNDNTTKKVFNAYLANTKSVDEIKLSQGTEKEKQKLVAANQEQFDNKLKGILTAAQYETYHHRLR